ILPPTSAEAARPVIAELKRRAVALLGTGDLAAIGTAIGEARVVALGEAAHGTREFTQWKQRLVEYLATKKGFTAIAAANEAEVHDLVERLHLEYAPLAGVTSSQAKVVVWTDNAHAREMHEKLGRNAYALAFAFRRGSIGAVGVEGGESRGHRR
ncbi:MAG: hypothetical protein LAQ30_29555, partial [Acidobacteriia bacterium]|nr:hypothetical protein [Terriglobia bacterium]